MDKYKATPKRHAALTRGTAFVVLFLMCVFATGFVVTQLDLTTQVKGILPIANGGTNSGTATGSGSVVLATSPTLATPSFTGDIGSNFGLGSSALLTTITNDTVTGTTANLLVKLSSSAPSKVILTGTGDTSGIVGVCLVNCGTAGSSGIAIHGQAGCTADNSITAGDYIVEGTTTAGRCKSAGAAPVTANQIIGRSLTTTSAASTATIMLFGQDIPDTAAAVNFATVPETPSGALTGTSFTLAHSPSPAGSLILSKNGQILTAGGVDYTLSGATITTVVAPGTGNPLVANFYTF
jgi:hypothetical protein